MPPKQGRLTLLLGLPGSGKSLLLKALSGQAKKDKRLRIEGDVLYNQDNIKTLCVERSAAYVDQVDNHLGALTVRETLNFSARCRWVTKTRRGVCRCLLESGRASQPIYPDMLQWIIQREQELGITPDPTLAAFMMPEKLKEGEDMRTMVCTTVAGMVMENVTSDARTAVHALPGLGCVCRHSGGLCLAAGYLWRSKAACDPWCVAARLVCVSCIIALLHR